MEQNQTTKLCYTCGLPIRFGPKNSLGKSIRLGLDGQPHICSNSKPSQVNGETPKEQQPTKKESLHKSDIEQAQIDAYLAIAAAIYDLATAVRESKKT